MISRDFNIPKNTETDADKLECAMYLVNLRPKTACHRANSCILDLIITRHNSELFLT